MKSKKTGKYVNPPRDYTRYRKVWPLAHMAFVSFLGAFTVFLIQYGLWVPLTVLIIWLTLLIFGNRDFSKKI